MSWAEEQQGWAAGHLGAIPEAPENLGQRRARSMPVAAAAAAAAAAMCGAEHWNVLHIGGTSFSCAHRYFPLQQLLSVGLP